jgi:hypothetical protein
MRNVAADELPSNDKKWRPARRRKRKLIVDSAIIALHPIGLPALQARAVEAAGF